MDRSDLLKKKHKRKPSSKDAGRVKSQKKTSKTLAHIVLKNGCRVDIPILPLNSSGLTIYENLRIAMEHAGLAMSWLNTLELNQTPVLTLSHNMDPIRLNLEDLMSHLYSMIENWPKSKDAL